MAFVTFPSLAQVKQGWPRSAKVYRAVRKAVLKQSHSPEHHLKETAKNHLCCNGIVVNREEQFG